MLVPYLNDSGFDCMGYDTGFFQDCILYTPRQQNVIIKDLRALSKNDLNGIDIVVNLAGISNDPLKNLRAERIYNPVRAYSLELAKLCKEHGIKFIFASSCSVYGKAGEKLLDEKSSTDPQTPYSLNKLQIENDLRSISDESFSPIILRFATVFGSSPRMRFDLVVNMFVGMAIATKKIVLNSDGQAWRPHVYIKDVCKAVKYCIDSDLTPGEPLILNVGDSSQNYSILQVADIVKNEVPGSEICFLNKKENFSDKEELIRDRKIQDGVDTRTYKVSFDLMKNTLKGFKCDFSVQEGIRTTVNDFKKIKMTGEQFGNINFYRLQKLESLLKNKYISEDLFWIKNRV